MPITADEVPVPVRCHADRAKMRPTREGRFCNECQHEVIDLSGLSESAVRRVLAAGAGSRVCVSYQPAADGTIVTRPEPRAPTLPREALLRKVRPGLLAASALLASGCGPAYDALPSRLQSALPDVAQAALQHPVDFAGCAVDPACDVSTFGRPALVPGYGGPPLVMGMMVAPTLPPTGSDEGALPEPCGNEGAGGE